MSTPAPPPPPSRMPRRAPAPPPSRVAPPSPVPPPSRGLQMGAPPPPRPGRAGRTRLAAPPRPPAPESVPWLTVVGNQPADVGSLLAAASRNAPLPSLRRSGVAVGLTAALDVLVTVQTGGSLALAAPRLVLGALTAVLSLATGTRGGWLRTISGLLGMLTAVAQGAFLAWSLVDALRSGTGILGLVPTLVTTAAALVAAGRTAALALRRRPRTSPPPGH